MNEFSWIFMTLFTLSFFFMFVTFINFYINFKSFTTKILSLFKYFLQP